LEALINLTLAIFKKRCQKEEEKEKEEEEDNCFGLYIKIIKYQELSFKLGPKVAEL
jgi:hypothetical protein